MARHVAAAWLLALLLASCAPTSDGQASPPPPLPPPLTPPAPLPGCACATSCRPYVSRVVDGRVKYCAPVLHAGDPSGVRASTGACTNAPGRHVCSVAPGMCGDLVFPYSPRCMGLAPGAPLPPFASSSMTCRCPPQALAGGSGINGTAGYGECVQAASEPTLPESSVCNCDPETGTCIPGQVVVSALPLRSSYIAAGIVGGLPALTVFGLCVLRLVGAIIDTYRCLCGAIKHCCSPKEPKAAPVDDQCCGPCHDFLGVPLAVLLTLLNQCGDLFTDMLYVCNSRFANEAHFAASITFLLGPVLPYAYVCTLPMLRALKHVHDPLGYLTTSGKPRQSAPWTSANTLSRSSPDNDVVDNKDGTALTPPPVVTVESEAAAPSGAASPASGAEAPAGDGAATAVTPSADAAANAASTPAGDGAAAAAAELDAFGAGGSVWMHSIGLWETTFKLINGFAEALWKNSDVVSKKADAIGRSSTMQSHAATAAAPESPTNAPVPVAADPAADPEAASTSDAIAPAAATPGEDGQHVTEKTLSVLGHLLAASEFVLGVAFMISAYLVFALGLLLSWVFVFLVLGPILWKAELLTIPMFMKSVSGRYFKPHSDGSPFSAQLYHMRIFFGVLLQSLPQLAIQVSNNVALRRLGFRESWSPSSIASVSFSTVSVVIGVKQIWDQVYVKKHGFEFKEWEMPARHQKREAATDAAGKLFPSVPLSAVISAFDM